MSITNYRKGWIIFRKTQDYKACSDAMKKKGIKQPYRDSILKTAFAAGWLTTGTEIKFNQ